MNEYLTITSLECGHMENPVGFSFPALHLSWKMQANPACPDLPEILWGRVQISEDEKFEHSVFDSGQSPALNGSCDVDLQKTKLKAACRYFWKVTVCAANGGKKETAESEPAWFITPKEEKNWSAIWITPKDQAFGRVGKCFSAPQAISRAHISVSGVGLYELYLDGEKVGDEYLAPGFNNYHSWIQFQTYVLTDIPAGEHRLDIYLGNGWYKGRFINMGPGEDHNKYGDKAAAILEAGLTYADGTSAQIVTDETWYAAESPIRSDDLYDGETLDEYLFGRVGDAPAIPAKEPAPAAKGEIKASSGADADGANDAGADIADIGSEGAKAAGPGAAGIGGTGTGAGTGKTVTGKVVSAGLGTERLNARYSLPVKIHETVKPAAVLHTPKNETVLDFGQNMAGWIVFNNRLEAGKECSYKVGEILQDDCFYNGNYRSAKSTFRYISDGREHPVRPHFTFFGFRYVLLEGFEDDIDPNDFTAEVLYSDMAETGTIETGNEKVNRLIQNVHWGQKSNFIDVPTDCPQRDERLGWTGDAQVFSVTGMYNMNAAPFYRKFIRDVRSEQEMRGGLVPVVVPDIGFENISSAAWSDCATIIPWNIYVMYADRSLLREQYPAMKTWADYIHGRDEISGGTRLWYVDNHFGDWLALGQSASASPTGATDMTLIATAYYYYSTQLCAKAAQVLGKTADEARYAKLAAEIKDAYQTEYVTLSGKLCEQTQTAYALTMQLQLGRDGKESVLADELEKLLKKNNNHLDTGFVGTPFLCPMLSKYGKNELAYTLLLQEDYPSWLYPVNMGATTIWERWNSVLPDGTMNPEGMNSLNHYAYGSIEQWMYQYMLGILPDEENPGWEHFCLHPMPDGRLGHASGTYESCRGRIMSAWRYEGDNLHFYFEIPLGTTASVQFGDTVQPGQELGAGTYEFTFPACSRQKQGYSAKMPLGALKADPKARAVLEEIVPELLFMPDELAAGTLEECMMTIFSGYSRLELKKADEALRAIDLNS